MSERYDPSAAWHYAAYRPPLHEIILDRALSTGQRFRVGLDVGCGTGYSAIALARYCDQVIGIDSSSSMLELATEHLNVTYIHTDINSNEQLPVDKFEIVTFAGSLFYMKEKTLRDSLGSLCLPGATIIVYDFRVDLDKALSVLGLSPPSVSGEYDYEVNLAGWEEFSTNLNGKESITLDSSEDQITHLLLADSRCQDALQNHFSRDALFDSVSAQLKKQKRKLDIYADIYFTRYSCEHG